MTYYEAIPTLLEITEKYPEFFYRLRLIPVKLIEFETSHNGNEISIESFDAGFGLSFSNTKSTKKTVALNFDGQELVEVFYKESEEFKTLEFEEYKANSVGIKAAFEKALA